MTVSEDRQFALTAASQAFANRGITIPVPWEGDLDDEERERFEAMVAAIDAHNDQMRRDLRSVEAREPSEAEVEAAARALAWKRYGYGDSRAVAQAAVDANWREFEDIARAALKAASRSTGEVRAVTDDQIAALVAWVREDVLPSYGISDEAIRADAELAEGARVALQSSTSSPSPAVPDGWVLVPRAYNEAMCDAFWNSVGPDEERYRAMLAAAPTTKPASGGSEAVSEERLALAFNEFLCHHEIGYIPGKDPKDALRAAIIVAIQPEEEHKQSARPERMDAEDTRDRTRGGVVVRTAPSSPPPEPVAWADDSTLNTLHESGNEAMVWPTPRHEADFPLYLSPSQSRDAVLEEAARVAERMEQESVRPTEWDAGYRQALNDGAAAIRSLKSGG